MNISNTKRILSGMVLLAALLSCRQEEVPGIEQDIFMHFTVSESLQDLASKGPDAALTETASSQDTLFAGNGFCISAMETERDASGATKVTPFGSTDGIGTAPIGVWCYLESATGNTLYTYSGAPAYPAIYPVTVPYNSSEKLWKPSPAIAFPTGQTAWTNAHFYAYAPASDKVSCTYPQNNTDQTAFALKYAVPADHTGQLDLLVADVSRSISEITTVPLSFSHILTGIRFKISADVSVRSITLQGIFDEASYDMQTGKWGSLAKKGNVYTLGPVNKTENNLDVSGREGTFSGELTWMMIPQILPESASLVAVLEDGTPEGKSISAPLPGHNWKAGKLVTYHIFRNETFHMEVDGKPSGSSISKTFPPEGGTQSVSVRSYNQRLIGGPEEMPWVLEFFDTEEAAAAAVAGTNISCPSWLQVSASGGTGSSTGETITLTVENGVVSTSSSTASLQGVAPVGTSSTPFNLSNPQASDSQDIVETANTYIVNAPGWYRLPLIAGNGIKGGGTNTRAMKGHNSAPATAYFKDYLDQSFENPQLHKSSALVRGTSAAGGDTCPKEAIVIWEESALIDGASSASVWVIPDALSYDSTADTWWLKFQITPDAIKPGCAVIAVRDNSGRIMWSWLIWVTDYVPKNYPAYAGEDIQVQRTSSASVTFMPRNLGWLDESTTETATAEQVYLRISQQEEGRYVILSVSRRGKNQTVQKGHGPYFQWGRKDPMLPYDLIAGAVIPEGGILAGQSLQVAGTTPVTIGTIIQNPDKFYPTSSLANTYTSTTDPCYLWWNAASATEANNTGNVTKTIYDPCPPSYRMPRRNEFEGFSTVGNDYNVITDSNGNNLGWEFYTHYQGEWASGGKTIYFPYTGSLNHSNGVFRFARPLSSNEYFGGIDASYWTAIPQGNGTANRLWFTSDQKGRHGLGIPISNDPDLGTSLNTYYEDNLHYINKGMGQGIRPVAE